MKNNEVDIDVTVNTEEIDKAIEKAEELEDILPKIVIKNKGDVYLTINRFVEDKEEV